MPARLHEQLGVIESQQEGIGPAARKPADGAAFALGADRVKGIDPGDERFEQGGPVAAIVGIGEGVDLIGHDDEEWPDGARADQLVGGGIAVQAYPLVVVVGLAVEHVSCRVARRPEIIKARRKVNAVVEWFVEEYGESSSSRRTSPAVAVQGTGVGVEVMERWWG